MPADPEFHFTTAQELALLRAIKSAGLQPKPKLKRELEADIRRSRSSQHPDGLNAKTTKRLKVIAGDDQRITTAVLKTLERSLCDLSDESRDFIGSSYRPITLGLLERLRNAEAVLSQRSTGPKGKGTRNRTWQDWQRRQLAGTAGWTMYRHGVRGRADYTAALRVVFGVARLPAPKDMKRYVALAFSAIARALNEDLRVWKAQGEALGIPSAVTAEEHPAIRRCDPGRE